MGIGALSGFSGFYYSFFMVFVFGGALFGGIVCLLF
jgi:hypothetical protein